MYISILATLLLELSLNLKKCIRIFERSEKILMRFFEFKVDSNNRVASIEIYTTLPYVQIPIACNDLKYEKYSIKYVQEELLIPLLAPLESDYLNSVSIVHRCYGII